LILTILANLESAAILIHILRQDNRNIRPSKFHCELPKVTNCLLSTPTNAQHLLVWIINCTRCTVHTFEIVNEVCYVVTPWQSAIYT